MAFGNATSGDAEMSHNVAFDWFTFLPYACRHFACSQLLFMCLPVCAFPYILAFTTDSIEIRLVVNGNLVYTAVVPELQLAASRVSVRTAYILAPIGPH